MSFSFYVEPQAVIGADSMDRQIVVGLGSDVDGERTLLGVVMASDAWSSIYLTRDELAHVIDRLMETLGAMDCEISV